MNRWNVSKFIACLSMLGMLGTAWAAQPSEPRPIASVEGITEYELDNGLRVLLMPEPSEPTITVNITYFVGSRHEAYGETGMAHLLEHLVFKGTPKHPNVARELTEHGAIANGTTWFDRTNYFETFAATDEHLAWALDLEADRMVNSFIAKKDLDSEMTVVRNEMERGENSPFRILQQRTLATAYLWHNYGKSTIGARSDVEGVPIDRLQGFYRKYYQPDNAILIVAGNFEPARAMDLIVEKFGRIPRPARTGDQILWPTYTREPAQDGERSVTLHRVGDVQLVMHCYHVPPGSHEEFAAIDLLAYILGDQPSGRLHKALVEPGHAARVGAMAYQLREAGPLMAFAEVRQDRPLAQAETALSAAMENLASTPITTEEVERARTARLNEMRLEFNDPPRFAREMSEWAAMGDWRLFFVHRDRLRSITPEQVRQVAAKYLKPSNRTVGRFIPTSGADRAEVPDVPNVASVVAAYQGSGQVAVGEPFEPDPQAIESRTMRRKLANGFEAALLPKRTRGQTVAVSLTLRLGNLPSLSGRATDGEMAAGMLMRGTAHRSRQQLHDELDKLQAEMSINGSATEVSASLRTVRENLPAALRLLREVVREPAFDAQEFELLRNEQLASIESQLSDPHALASTALSRVRMPLPADHPNYIPTIEEKRARIAAADLSSARNFHIQVYGADAGVISIVGDFDPQEITDVLREMFEPWNARTRYQRISTPHRPADAAKLIIRTPEKANAAFFAGLALPMRDDHQDYPALVLSNYIFGQGFLSSRLATRIRQKEGLSYGVGSGFSADAHDELALFTASAIHAPQNAQRLVAAFQEELDLALRDGFTDEEVRNAQKGYLEYRRNTRSRDPVLAGQISREMVHGRTMLWQAELEAKIAALTPEQVTAAFRRHIDPAAVSTVRAGDYPEPIDSK